MSDDAARSVRHAVMLPFLGRLPQVAHCLRLLLARSPADTRVVLVDDGSATPAASDPELATALADPRVVLLRHERNRGVAAARNTALRWCRANDVDLVVMIDSDCEPPVDFVQQHLALHAAHPDAAAIGGAIDGVGSGFWALMDRAMTWTHCTPGSPAHEVREPYHLVTTNFSVKLNRLPDREAVFDERLYTGEDAVLVRELRRTGERVLFEPRPVVQHSDRTTFRGLLWHHYQYGHHQYFVQLGNDVSPRCFNPAYRAAFVAGFLPLAPLYALAGSMLNLRPWLPRAPRYALLFPLMYLLWLAKSVAIVEAAVRPHHVTRPALDG